ncbi:MAG: putative GNAT family acetyltransferase [Oceanicoccus sp.]|jgi:predicted GNAT family acetyltransferase
MNNNLFDIDHQREQKRFIIVVADDAAVLEYQLLDNNIVDFTRTYVPPRHRGQGHAEALVQAGLAWANQQGYQLQASCWYVDKFLKLDAK